jgi:hypothetical protein
VIAMTYLSAVAIPVYAVHGYAFGLDSKTFSTNVPGGTDSEVFLQEHKRVLQIDVLICTSVPCGTSVENLAPD